MLKDCETKAGRSDLGYGTLTWNGKPYGPRFLSYDQAVRFIQFVGDKTGLDPHHQTEEALDGLATKFQAAA